MFNFVNFFIQLFPAAKSANVLVLYVWNIYKVKIIDVSLCKKCISFHSSSTIGFSIISINLLTLSILPKYAPTNGIEISCLLLSKEITKT